MREARTVLTWIAGKGPLPKPTKQPGKRFRHCAAANERLPSPTNPALP